MDFNRRLPVYILVDTSGSMIGEPIEAVKQGIKMLLTELKGDPMALETAYLSIITFDSSARVASPLTELANCIEPQIAASGYTAMGEALELLIETIKKDVRRSTKEQKGDYRPLVFILTDGKPTDSEKFNKVVSRLSDTNASAIVACGAGANADAECLKKITENVLMMNTTSAGDMAKFFKYVSDSIIQGSKSVNKGVEDNNLPAPPEGFVVVP